MASQSRTNATVAIISIGDMGGGIASLLLANNFRVITNVTGRSQATQDRVKRISVETVATDEELCNAADYIFSIAPPRDALATAQRIAAASTSERIQKRTNPLYFLELNAVSPSTVRSLAALLESSVPHVKFIDGGIIGLPPKEKDGGWTNPRIATSGPDRLDAAQPSGALLAKILDVQHVADAIGSASGLKMCFASISKGFQALALQSFTTAHNLGVMPELKQFMEDYNPNALKSVAGFLPGMPPKAYRWVREMEEIAKTFRDDGGFEANESIFDPIARVYGAVADDTDLGLEHVDKRSRGQTLEDVALVMSEGLTRRKLKKD